MLHFLKSMPKEATFEDLRVILSNHWAELERILNTRQAQFQIPTDGKGLRIQVAVPGHQKPISPHRLQFPLGGNKTVQLKVEPDPRGYQDYQPFASFG